MTGYSIKRIIFHAVTVAYSCFLISCSSGNLYQEQESSVEGSSAEGFETSEEMIAEPVPLPTYEFHIEEVTVQLPELERDYRLAWVSDLHIIADIPFSDENTDVAQNFYETIQNRYDNTFVAEDGVHSKELWPEIVNWLNAQDLDGVILGGDMLDYYSEANMEVLGREYERIMAPVMYIRADHDYEVKYSEWLLSENDARKAHEDLDGNNWNVQHFDFPEFMVLGVNDSHKSAGGILWDNIEPAFESEKPIIFVSHIPYGSEVDNSLMELSMAVRGKEYYWNSETYKPKEYQGDLLEKVYDPESGICQVLAGHIHINWDGMITDMVPEHIFGPAFAGNIGIINVVSK